MKKLLTLALAALLAVGGLISAGLTSAGEPAAKDNKKQERLTDEGLTAALKAAGFAPQITKSGDGTITYNRLDTTVLRFRYIIDVSLQERGAAVYFSIPLKLVGEPEKVPAEKLWELLKKNDTIAPMFFSFEESRKQLFLNYQIENHDLTPPRLQAELEKVRHVSSTTAPLWDTSRWPGGPQPAVKTAATKSEAK